MLMADGIDVRRAVLAHLENSAIVAHLAFKTAARGALLVRHVRPPPGVRMADISEEQVSGADAALGAKEHEEERRKGEIRETVHQLFEEISDEDRVLLTLKEVEGLSLKELREIFKVKESAIKVRLFRARKRALKALQGLKEQGKVLSALSNRCPGGAVATLGP